MIVAGSLLLLSTLGKILADDILKYFCYFSQKTGFDMNGQILFSGKIITNLSSAELQGSNTSGKCQFFFFVFFPRSVFVTVMIK